MGAHQLVHEFQLCATQQIQADRIQHDCRTILLDDGVIRGALRIEFELVLEAVAPARFDCNAQGNVRATALLADDINDTRRGGWRDRKAGCGRFSRRGRGFAHELHIVFDPSG